MGKRKRKNNKNETSRHLFSKKTKIKSFSEGITLEDENVCDEDSLCRELLHKLRPCANVEDENVLQIFRQHTISKIKGNHLQKLLKLSEIGMC